MKPSTSFGWLNTTQFLGALNDNLFKLLLIFFLIDLQGPESANSSAALVGLVFVLPFLVFSAAAGCLVDRISKQRLIFWSKGAEFAIMGLGVAAFTLQSVPGLYLCLLLMAFQSTLFSPAKYGIIPELVPEQQLSAANGQLEALTYMAIITGTALAPLLPLLSGGRYGLAAALCLVIGAVGLLTAGKISPTPPAGGSRRGSPLVIPDLVRALRFAREDHFLLLAILGSAWFMLLAAFFQINLIPFGMQELGLNQQQSGALFVVAALGIGGGSLAAGKLSGRNIEFGIVPLGALGLTLATFLLALLPARLPLILLTVGLLGFSAGLIIVPLNAFIQQRAPQQRRGEILAATNVLGWCGVLLASLLLLGLGELGGLSSRACFGVVGLLTLGLTLFSFLQLPDFFIRFLALLLMRLLYRIDIRGQLNVPTKEGALLVANHVSWVDALLLVACEQRRIRFLMERGIYNRPWLRPFFRLMGVIPISSRDGRKQVVASLRQARQSLDDGYLVCIFAEGQITRNATIGEFKGGFETIVKGSHHPIIPVHLGGLWGSLFSFANGGLLRGVSSRFPYPVEIRFGHPLPAESKADQVRQAVMELSSDWFSERQKERPSLGWHLVRTARANWRRPALGDSSGRQLSFGSALIAARLLERRLATRCWAEGMVGVILPPSVPAALANLALTIGGKVPVNLNFTASPEAFVSACHQCQLKTVITTAAMLERLEPFALPGQVLLIEDLLNHPTYWEKITGWLTARLLPTGLWAPLNRLKGEATASILFSSGSTGKPKGVMLSHRNLLANIDSLQMLVSINPHDKVCAALPFFHSLGLTGTFWLPLLSGMAACFHSNPLEGTRIAELVRSERCTLLFATPTFLLAYLRRAKPEDFRSLRLVITGAEKLQPALAEKFEKRFGIRPLEGYGATELAPVAAISLPDVEAHGVRQKGSKVGAVGRPLPGVALRVVDPETRKPVTGEAEGLILVKGANVMQGYLEQPEKTAEALEEGWYNTGDIGFIDREGFLHITDRLARFSKIGGEMVPHLAIEEALLQGLHGPDVQLAVTAIPDEKRGERLIVLHNAAAGDSESLFQRLTACDLPNLWRPARDSFMEIPKLPLLGTGKRDLHGIRQIALERLSSHAPDSQEHAENPSSLRNDSACQDSSSE